MEPAVAAAGPAERTGEPAPRREPAAAPAGLPVQHTGPLTLEVAREHWRDIYSLTHRLNVKAGALLNSGCDIVEVEDGAIVFGFRHEWMVGKMNSDDGGSNLKALQEAVSQVLGQGLNVRCVHAPETTSRPVSTRRGGHLVEAARELGARIVPEQE